MRRRLAAAAALSLAVLAAPAARAEELDGRSEAEIAEEEREGSGEAVQGAKSFGVHTPRGRSIYRPDERFSEIVDSRRRVFVIEAAAGLGPEGNVGIVFGYLPKAIHGVEFYGGAGLEANPAYRLTGAVRFLFNIKGYRPYAGLGYFFKDAYVIDTFAHAAFIEAGYSFKLKSTNHFTVGLGLARIIHVGVRDRSVLRTPDVDKKSLDEQIDAVPRWQPMFVFRVSHAF